MTQEILTYIQIGVTVIGVLSLLWQNRILRAEISAQKTQIASLESYNKMFDLAKLREANNFIMEGFTIKNEKEKEAILKEKEEMQQKLEEAYAKHKLQENLLEEVKVKDSIIDTQDNAIFRFAAELDECKETNKSLQDQIYFYLNTNSELIGVNIKLIATFIKKHRWNEFIDKNTVEVAGLLKETMQTRGVAFLNDLKKKQAEKTTEAFNNSALLKKLIKSNIYRNQSLNYIPDYNFDEDYEEAIKSYEESLNVPPDENIKTPNDDTKTSDEEDIKPPKD